MYYSQWVALPLSTRVKIAQLFGIAKTGSTHVVGNEIVLDGYKIQDVEATLSSEAVREYVGADADPASFIALLAAKVENPGPTGVVSLETEPAPAPKKAKKVTKRKK